jgi:hypothetical protein
MCKRFNCSGKRDIFFVLTLLIRNTNRRCFQRYVRAGLTAGGTKGRKRL